MKTSLGKVRDKVAEVRNKRGKGEVQRRNSVAGGLPGSASWSLMNVESIMRIDRTNIIAPPMA